MKRLQLREGWSTFFLLGAMVLTVTGAIQRADWTDDLAILTPITVVGLLLGLVFAKWSRLHALLAHLLAIVAGGAFILWQMLSVPNLLPLPYDKQNFTGAIAFLSERAQVWYAATGTAQYADDFYLFVLGIGALLWLTSYLCVWMVFRLRWIWPAVLLPATILLVNLGYASSVVSSYLLLFVVCALLLIVRFHIAEREEDWRRNGVTFPTSLGWRALWVGIIVVVLTVGFGWGAPFAVSGRPLETLWNRVNGPWLQLESAFNQRFGSLRGNNGRGVGNFASFGDRFRLGGPLKLSQTPVLVLQADQPYYLKARTYDTFDGQGWSSNVNTTFVSSVDGRQYAPQIDLAASQPLPVPALQGNEQRDLTVRVLQPKGNSYFSADQFLSSDQQTLVVMSWTQYRNQSIDLNTVNPNDLPPDLRPIYNLLKSVPGPMRNTDDQGNILRVPAPVTLTPQTPRTRNSSPSPSPTPVMILPPIAAYEQPIEDERNSLATRLVNLNVRIVVKNGLPTRMIINGQLPNYGDVEAVFPYVAAARGATYSSKINTVTALSPDLREAGTAYPDWVANRYLQLPASTTDRTRQLAKDLENGQNPYDAAVTIQNWLHDNIVYNENINYPPADRDLVDYVLFDKREGYCEYYSSAMVIMLRSLGIPARVAVGFFSGEYDQAQNGFLYRESNAHAWPEAYFPGYGWVKFEPTSSRQVFDREPAPPPGAEPDPGNTSGGGGGPGAVGGGGEFPDDPFMNDQLFPGGSTTVPQPPSRFWQVMRVAVPVLLLLSGVLAMLWFLGLRGLSSSSQFYARMTRSSQLAGVRPPPGTTPYEWARVVGERVPDAQRSLDQIANLYVREQYAGQQATQQELRLAQRAWLTIRSALLRSVVSLRRARPNESGD